MQKAYTVADTALAGARERETLASARGLTKLLDMDAPAAGMRDPSVPRSPTPVPPLACAAAALQRLALRRARCASHCSALSTLCGCLNNTTGIFCVADGAVLYRLCSDLRGVVICLPGSCI